jgi:hypothetical protein
MLSDLHTKPNFNLNGGADKNRAAAAAAAADLAETESKVKAAAAALTENDEKIKALDAAIAAAGDDPEKLAELEAEKAPLVKERETLEAEQQDLEAQVEAAKTAVAAADAAVQEEKAEAVAEGAAADLAEAESKVEAAAAALTENDEKIKALDAAIAAAGDDPEKLAELEAEKAPLVKERETLEAEQQDLEAQVEAAREAAERKAQEEAERKAQEEAERKAAEEKAANNKSKTLERRREVQKVGKYSGSVTVNEDGTYNVHVTPIDDSDKQQQPQQHQYQQQHQQQQQFQQQQDQQQQAGLQASMMALQPRLLLPPNLVPQKHEIHLSKFEQKTVMIKGKYNYWKDETLTGGYSEGGVEGDTKYFKIQKIFFPYILLKKKQPGSTVDGVANTRSLQKPLPSSTLTTARVGSTSAVPSDKDMPGQRIMVDVPDYAGPGQQLQVNVFGHDTIPVIVPNDHKKGGKIYFTVPRPKATAVPLPADDETKGGAGGELGPPPAPLPKATAVPLPAPPSPPEQMNEVSGVDAKPGQQIKVNEVSDVDAKPGQQIKVNVPDGGSVSVTVPHGYNKNHKIYYTVPPEPNEIYISLKYPPDILYTPKPGDEPSVFDIIGPSIRPDMYNDYTDNHGNVYLTRKPNEKYRKYRRETKSLMNLVFNESLFGPRKRWRPKEERARSIPGKLTNTLGGGGSKQTRKIRKIKNRTKNNKNKDVNKHDNKNSKNKTRRLLRKKRNSTRKF